MTANPYGPDDVLGAIARAVVPITTNGVQRFLDVEPSDVPGDGYIEVGGEGYTCARFYVQITPDPFFRMDPDTPL